MGTRLFAVAVALYLFGGTSVGQECETFLECRAGMCQDGQCVGVPLNGGECDDFNPCTTNDTCMNGACHGTPNVGGACDDGNECTVGETCTNLGEGPVTCFSMTPAEEGTRCQGGCGTCEPVVPVPGALLLCRTDPEMTGAACTPANVETLGLCFVGRCSMIAGFPFCSPTAKQCPDDGDRCTGEFCNPDTGDCETVPLPLRTDCFPPDCHRCEASTGACVPINVGGACDDFNVCTSSTVCTTQGMCVAGNPPLTATPTATIGVGNTPTPTSTAPTTPTHSVAANTATPTRTQGTPLPTATPGRCVGDCDRNGQVRVNEMVTGVNIALERGQISQCPSFDINGNLRVEVNELVSGVNSLVRGCVVAAALRRQ